MLVKGAPELLQFSSMQFKTCFWQSRHIYIYTTYNITYIIIWYMTLHRKSCDKKSPIVRSDDKSSELTIDGVVVCPFASDQSPPVVLAMWLTVCCARDGNKSWRHQIETFSALLALCAGNSPVTGEFPAQRLVTRSFDAFLSAPEFPVGKQSWGWWCETSSHLLWRHYNDPL